MIAIVSLLAAGLTTNKGVPPLHSRRAVLAAAAMPALTVLPVSADDDLDDNDEIPLAPVTPKARKKPGSEAGSQSYSAADVKYAFADLIAARQELNTITRFVVASDFGSVAPLLGKPPFSSVERNLLALVQGPGLTPDAKKQIGTIKRYGVGADVLIMLGGLSEAITGADVPKSKSFVEKSKDALDEVIAIGNEGGLAK